MRLATQPFRETRSGSALRRCVSDGAPTALARALAQVSELVLKTRRASAMAF
jgi:hypothetical protein